VTSTDYEASDADLVHRALGGGREPLAVLMQRHWETAVSLAARMLGSRDLAHDAAQEAAIAAMTNLDQLRSPERFGAWFCGITLNIARRWLRELRSELRFELPVEPADQPSPHPGPAEVAEAADLADRVRTAIAALPDGQRHAVLLFYLQGLSHREVAAELGISPGAVKARLHQGRAALAPRLAHVIDNPEVRTMTTTDSAAAATWVDAYVSEIRRTEGDDIEQCKHIMILAERNGDRWLPMWIGPAEATALALTMESVETPRPFTYKLAANLVEATGSAVAEVRITRLQPPIFYASVLVRSPQGMREVDARPSDAVNLAMATGAPIRVDDQLLAAVGPGEFAAELGAYPVATAALAAEAKARLEEIAQQRRP
jgi:RNA polymerase sigma factor (sigma-70 family)